MKENFNLNSLTSEMISSYIKEQISEEDFKDFLNKVITEENFEDYYNFFKNEYEKIFYFSDSSKTARNEYEIMPNWELYLLLKLFLLFTETKTTNELERLNIEVSLPSDATDDVSKRILRDLNLDTVKTLFSYTLAELEFFNANSTVPLPVKKYIRDNIYYIYHGEFGKRSYQSIQNIESELSEISTYAKNLVRYKHYNDETPTEISEADLNIPGYSYLLNKNSNHNNYLKSISGTTKDIFFINGIGNEAKITINAPIVFPIEPSIGTESLSSISDSIADRTIHYKI